VGSAAELVAGAEELALDGAGGVACSRSAISA
jgi:hypothetical protein